MTANTNRLEIMQQIFGDKLQENVNLYDYTTVHVGGKADGFVVIHSIEEIITAVSALHQNGIPYKLIGSGANIVVSDRGYRGVILLNRAHNIKIDTHGAVPVVIAESGANFSSMGRITALRSFYGMEWAATIPGTVGGAVYGNAGAFGSNTQSCLIEADIFTLGNGRQTWLTEQFCYEYRSSILKREKSSAVILNATFRLEPGDTKTAMARIKEFNTKRRSTQPPGASMGSTFKNPPGDYAGRLIESAGLKGTSVGEMQISEKHANFFINRGEAKAKDVYELIQLAKKTVFEKFGVQLETEIELLGEF